MFKNIKYRRAFHYWQYRSGMHPLTCGEHGWINLEIKYIKNGKVCLYCPKCDYEQMFDFRLQGSDMILDLYNERLKDSKIKVKVRFNPRLWVVGVQWLAIELDIIIVLPMLLIRIYRKFRKPYESMGGVLNIMDNENIKDILAYINDQIDKDDGSVINFIRGAYLQLIAQEIHKNAVDHGWWDEGERNVGELFMLCVSELAEAFEEYRNDKKMDEVYYSKDAQGNDKPEGIPSEIADTIIRLLDICGFYNINIGEMVMEKHLYNKSRPYRHGNKKC